jgi:hypothetical protein
MKQLAARGQSFTARKPARQKAIRLNITLNPTLTIVLQNIITTRGFSGPVDYFQSRIRLDGGLGLSTDEQTARQPYSR